jgi:hypothetical protein
MQCSKREYWHRFIRLPGRRAVEAGAEPQAKRLGSFKIDREQEINCRLNRNEWDWADAARGRRVYDYCGSSWPGV